MTTAINFGAASTLARGRAMRVRYALADCPLGRLLAAGTERGLCAVYLGDRDGRLEAELSGEFGAAPLRRDDDGLRAWLDELVAHLADRRPCLDLPLDVEATAFRWRVWRELCAIPYGQTRSYRALAAALGQPGAARAVGRACATNPVSLVIPCHRAVREDGGLGGYRWGLDRKRALLAWEKEAASVLAE